MIRINEIKLPLDADKNDLLISAAKLLKIPAEKIKSLAIAKKSLDSRKKSNLFFVYSVDVEINGNEQKTLQKLTNRSQNR